MTKMGPFDGAWSHAACRLNLLFRFSSRFLNALTFCAMEPVLASLIRETGLARLRVCASPFCFAEIRRRREQRHPCIRPGSFWGSSFVLSRGTGLSVLFSALFVPVSGASCGCWRVARALLGRAEAVGAGLARSDRLWLRSPARDPCPLRRLRPGARTGNGGILPDRCRCAPLPGSFVIRSARLAVAPFTCRGLCGRTIVGHLSRAYVASPQWCTALLGDRSLLPAARVVDGDDGHQRECCQHADNNCREPRVARGPG